MDSISALRWSAEKVQVTPGTTPESTWPVPAGQGADRRTGRHDSVKHSRGRAGGSAPLPCSRGCVRSCLLSGHAATPPSIIGLWWLPVQSTQLATNTEQPKSSFHECWSQAFNWGEPDFNGSTVLDLWNFHGKTQLIDQGVLKANQVTLDDLKFDGEEPGVDGMTRKHRQWYVCQPAWPGGGEYYFDGEGYLNARAGWKFPLHCIDFETSAVAILFLSVVTSVRDHRLQFRIMSSTKMAGWSTGVSGSVPNLVSIRTLISSVRYAMPSATMMGRFFDGPRTRTPC